MKDNSVTSRNNNDFATALIFMAGRMRMDSKYLANAANISQRMVNYVRSRSKSVGKEKMIALSAVVGLDFADMLRLGRLINEGVPGESALEQIGRIAQIGSGNIVNNGVMSVGGDAPVPAEGGEARDEIRVELERWLAERFPKLSVSAKVAAREAIRRSVPDFAEYVEQCEQRP